MSQSDFYSLNRSQMWVFISLEHRPIICRMEQYNGLFVAAQFVWGRVNNTAEMPRTHKQDYKLDLFSEQHLVVFIYLHYFLKPCLKSGVTSATVKRPNQHVLFVCCPWCWSPPLKWSDRRSIICAMTSSLQTCSVFLSASKQGALLLSLNHL